MTFITTEKLHKFVIDLYSLSEIAQAIDSVVTGLTEAEKDWHLLIDSRTLTHPETTIFFALKTQNNDGHLYIPELISKGVTTFVVDRNYSIPLDEQLNFLPVDNVLIALQKLSTYHRNRFELPVIGITGSNGKTIVKEWLVQLLGDSENVCASPKSFNSQLGVPLSVWQLNRHHTLGIFEAGISASGEMQHLANIIQPEIGILTHLGPAHNQGFDTPDEKIQEKLLLFQKASVILMQHNPQVMSKTDKKIVSFGYQQPAADLNIISRKIEGKITRITGTYQEKNIQFTIPFTDEASIENACLCCLSLLYLNRFKAEDFMFLGPVSMRMELKRGIHNSIIINDSYSNDLHGLGTALSFLEQQAIHPTTTVILSDIEESGLQAEILYIRVRQLLNDKKVDRLIAIGNDFQRCFDASAYSADVEFYETTELFLEQINTSQFRDENILIKGARKFQFEKIVKKLEQTAHGTILEINLSAALHNLNAIRGILPAGMKIMAMVKAFAYGSGTYEMAKLIKNRVDYLAVAYADEGVALRQNGIQTPIMVMNPEFETLDLILQYRLEPVVFSLSQLKALTEFISLRQISSLSVHIELDTGMHRLGYTDTDIDELCEILAQVKTIKVASIFSHLSASDEQQYDDFTQRQFERLKTQADKIEKTLGYTTIKHISNTAASLRFNQEGLNMIRLGIGLYGIDPTGMFPKLLEPVFTFKTIISQIKQIEANESVGYARKAISNHSRRIAILALGYADGLNRQLSNGVGACYIRGKQVPITGNICMDMCMVDVTGIDCEEGDEAIIFGKDIRIESIAEKLNTIPYEILTSISQRVKRVYVSD
ncbi:MAG: bifunctional UDP-N-acetylmuramoyl-tripeptide:D-alanyl-D-alanine ligase/alanine racemase [Chitinophagaceae bacterium]